MAFFASSAIFFLLSISLLSLVGYTLCTNEPSCLEYTSHVFVFLAYQIMPYVYFYQQHFETYTQDYWLYFFFVIMHLLLSAVRHTVSQLVQIILENYQRMGRCLFTQRHNGGLQAVVGLLPSKATFCRSSSAPY